MDTPRTLSFNIFTRGSLYQPQFKVGLAGRVQDLPSRALPGSFSALSEEPPGSKSKHRSYHHHRHNDGSSKDAWTWATTWNAVKDTNCNIRLSQLVHKVAIASVKRK